MVDSFVGRSLREDRFLSCGGLVGLWMAFVVSEYLHGEG